MTKATEAFLTLFSLSALYFGLYSGVIPTSQKIHDDILPYLPFCSLVTFGAYALGTLGWGVYTFKDKEDKYNELRGQIKEAQEFYKAKGISLD